MGNGNEASGDGWRFRGGGPLQLTGRDNWTGFAKAMGMSLDDALAYGRTVEGGVMTAAWFWEANDINRLADTPGVADESKKINGGVNGLADREAKFNALVAALLRAGG
jgi:putative chitinase